jgi:hypothetical protein
VHPYQKLCANLSLLTGTLSRAHVEGKETSKADIPGVPWTRFHCRPHKDPAGSSRTPLQVFPSKYSLITDYSGSAQLFWYWYRYLNEQWILFSKALASFFFFFSYEAVLGQ